MILSVQYNHEVLIYCLDYEIKTSTSVLLVFATVLVLVILTACYLLHILFKPNVKKYKRKYTKKEERLQQKHEEYLELITLSVINLMAKDFSKSDSYRKKSNSYFKNFILSEFLKIKILIDSGKYKKALNYLNEIEGFNKEISAIRESISLDKEKKKESARKFLSDKIDLIKSKFKLK